MYNMDYVVLEELYNELTSLINKIINNIDWARKIVDKMDDKDHWKGNGYDNYKEKFKALATNFEAYCNNVYKLNNNIKTSIERIKSVDANVMSSIR